MPRVTALKINSVWSSYGHTFMSSGEVEEFDGNVKGYYVDCLTCGAHYVLRATPDGTSDGGYFANNGDDPMECSRDTGMAHGYPGERYCHEHQHPRDYSEHECSHVAHNCNCILCDN